MGESKTNNPINTILLVVTLGLLAWIATSVQSQSVSSAEMKGKILELDNKIELANKNRWSSAHQKIWTQELSRVNPSLQVPDPTLVNRIFDN